VSPPRPSRRIILKAAPLILLIAAGATLNVAVAWGCALYSSQERDLPTRKFVLAGPLRWPQYLEVLQWPMPVQSEQLELLDGFGATVIEMWGGDVNADYPRSDSGTSVYVSLESRQFGMPCRTLQWELHLVIAGARGLDIAKTAAAAAGLRTGIDVSKRIGADKEGRRRCLPLTPLWPGFAINTLFYAGVLWMLFVGPFALRRMIRRRRGRCAHCAYPIGQSPVCTECGAELPPRRGAGL